MAESKPTILIVEDEKELAELIAEQLEEAGMRTQIFNRIAPVARFLGKNFVNLMLLDINLPDGSGIDGAERLKRLIPQVQILMFTIYEDSEQILHALEAGASGYLLKRTAPEDLLRAIREIKSGGVPMTPEVARKVIRSFERKPAKSNPPESLTKREEEILDLLSRGMLSKEIARELSISVETVNSHLKHIYGKLHVRTRTEAVIKFLK